MAQKKSAPRSKGMSSRKKAARSSSELERYEKALEAFERAVKVFHKGDYAKAKGQLESFLSAFPGEQELADRVRTYVVVCDNKLNSDKPYKPKQLEELVTHGVFLLNQGNYDEAIKHLSKAVEMAPESDHAHYCLAAAYARIGDGRGASRHLKRAISTDAYNRVRAKTDSDFDSMRNDPSITELLAEEATRAST